MSGSRPEENASSSSAASERNDALILDALGKLEEPKSRGKMKVTVASIESLTGLSRSTIRNRAWAVTRLKMIKKGLKKGTSEPPGASQVDEDEVSILKRLRTRVRNSLKQNALLYEEILTLQRVVERKDTEIRELKARND